MKEVKLKITRWLKDKPEHMELEGTVGVPSTDAAVLREVVEKVLPEANTAGWEAFFYDVNNEGMLLAYLSDSEEHEVFHDPEVLKAN